MVKRKDRSFSAQLRVSQILTEFNFTETGVKSDTLGQDYEQIDVGFEIFFVLNF